MTGGQAVLAGELEAQGWTRQFTVEAGRADEYVELYESLGDEVRVEPVTPDLMADEECAICLLVACEEYVIIYTRLKECEDEPEVQVLLSPPGALRRDGCSAARLL